MNQDVNETNDIVFQEGKLTLEQKLSEVKRLVPYIQKNGSVSFGSTKYNCVTSSGTLTALNSAINQQKLILEPAIIDTKITETKNGKGNPEFIIQLTMTYTWINSEDKNQTRVCPWVALINDGDLAKGLGKALTYTEKYFLIKYFNIATDSLDPDDYKLLSGEYEKELDRDILLLNSPNEVEEYWKEHKKTSPDIEMFNAKLKSRKEFLVNKIKKQDIQNNKK